MWYSTIFFSFFPPPIFNLIFSTFSPSWSLEQYFLGKVKRISPTCWTNGPFYLSEHNHHILFIPIFCKISISITFFFLLWKKCSLVCNVPVAFLILEFIHQACKRALRFTVIHLSNKYLLTTYHTSVIWNASVNRSDSNCALWLYILVRHMIYITSIINKYEFFGTVKIVSALQNKTRLRESEVWGGKKQVAIWNRRLSVSLRRLNGGKNWSRWGK